MTERFVEVVHLSENADDDYNREDVSTRVRELIVSGEGELERNAEAFDRHDGNAADGRTDGQVNHRIALAVHWRDLVDHHKCEDGDKRAVEHKTWLVVSNCPSFSSYSSRHTRIQSVSEQLVDVLQWVIRRRVQHNDHTADQADCATNSS